MCVPSSVCVLSSSRPELTIFYPSCSILCYTLVRRIALPLRFNVSTRTSPSSKSSPSAFNVAGYIFARNENLHKKAQSTFHLLDLTFALIRSLSLSLTSLSILPPLYVCMQYIVVAYTTGIFVHCLVKGHRLLPDSALSVHRALIISRARALVRA